MKINNELHQILKSNKNADKKSVVEDKDKDLFKSLLKETNEKADTQILISKHAQKRLEQRDIKIDNEEYLKILSASQKLRSKGSKESLIVTDKAAYIMDINKNTLVTVMTKKGMNENIVTNIDSTIFV
jgi:flagellar operon protein